jgi:hypothetical protein
MVRDAFHRIFLILIFCAYGHSAIAGSEQIIDGFSEFLVERANTNFIAIFERRLKDDKNFQCYFPETYGKIESLQLNNLFVSRNYWQGGLEADLDTLLDRAILVEAQRGLKILNRNTETETIIKTLQYFEYEHKGKRYPLDRLDIGWEKSVRDEVNGFSYGLAESINKTLDAVRTKSLLRDMCRLHNEDKEQLKNLIQPYLDLAGWSGHVARYGKNLRLSAAGKQAFYCRHEKIADADCAAVEYNEAEFVENLIQGEDFGRLRKAAEIADRIERAHAAFDTLDRKQADGIDRISALLPLLRRQAGFTAEEIEGLRQSLEQAKGMDSGKRRREIAGMAVRIKERMSSDPDAIRIGELLRDLIEEKRSYTDRALAALELLEDSDIFSPASYDRLYRSVMFFVAIADSEDKDTVKATLRAYALDASSFSEKRKPGRGYFISSYLGVADADAEMRGSALEESGSGLFVPVGVEYNRGFSGGHSWSLMFSPFDMAYPVNLKLNGIEQDVDMDEIVAPSLTIAYGLEDYPLNIGFGYQRGRMLEDVGEAEERFLLFISLDMPLFRLY